MNGLTLTLLVRSCIHVWTYLSECGLVHLRSHAIVWLQGKSGQTLLSLCGTSHQEYLAWNASHLFSGGYEGWLRAMCRLQQANLGFSFSSHTSVDWSEEVMHTWSFNHGRPYEVLPIGVDYNPVMTFNGILADVSEITLLRATSHKSNLVMTLSPPCPSWSRGGRNSGLATDEGFCFLDAIQHVARTRPLLALFECSDGIEARAHWRAISAALQLAGYQKIWSQDVAIHQITGNHRTRWLAVWGRKDITFSKLDERFLCTLPRRLPWDDPRHLFSLPEELTKELSLSEEQMQIYGDRNLLPPAKRARMCEDTTRYQILEQRVPQRGDYLPTLCASYTGQHLLQRDHLDAKGIFAALTRKDEEFSFIDPFAFVALFGTTDSIGLPVDLRKAFHQLGNAISQLHALIAILFAMEGVSGESYPKLALVQQCWEERLTVDKALVRRCEDMYVLQPFADFIAKALPSIVTWQPWLSGRTMIRFCDDVGLIPVNVPWSQDFLKQMMTNLDLARHHESLLQFMFEGRFIPSRVGWDDLPCGEVVVKLCKWSGHLVPLLVTTLLSPQLRPGGRRMRTQSLSRFWKRIKLVSCMLWSTCAKMRTPHKKGKSCCCNKMGYMNGFVRRTWIDLAVFHPFSTVIQGFISSKETRTHAKDCWVSMS